MSWFAKIKISSTANLSLVLFLILATFLTIIAKPVNAEPLYIHFGSRLAFGGTFQNLNITDNFLQITENPYESTQNQSFNAAAANFSFSLYTGFSDRLTKSVIFLFGADLHYLKASSRSAYLEGPGVTENKELLNPLTYGNISYDRKLENILIFGKAGVSTVAALLPYDYYQIYIEPYAFILLGAARHKLKSDYRRDIDKEFLTDEIQNWMPNIGIEIGTNIYFYKGIYAGFLARYQVSINVDDSEEKFKLSSFPALIHQSSIMLTIGFTFNYRLNRDSTYTKK